MPLFFPSLEEVVRNVAQLSDSAFNSLQSLVSKQGFQIESEQCERLAKEMSLSQEQTLYLLSALAFMYRQAESASESNETLARNLSDELGDNTVDLPKLTKRLTMLLAPNPQADKEIKINRLKTGFLKSATGFGSFVDLRPNFSDDLKTLHSLVPMVQFRISTDARDPTDANFVFQVDEEGLAKMKEAIERTEEKLRQLSVTKFADLLVRKK
jgi:hypothetical protein